VKLDISKLKKIKATPTHSTFKHDKGHEVTIAHAGLSKGMKDQLDGIAMHVPKDRYYSTKGYVEPDDEQDYSQGLTPQQQLDATDTAETPDNSQSMTPQQQMSTATPTQQPSAPYTPDMSQATNPAIPPAPTSTPVTPDMAPMTAAVKEYGEAQQSEAKHIGQQGRQEAKVLDQNDTDLQNVYNDAYGPDGTLQDIMTQRMAVISDLNKGHIDPKNFWASKGTGSKIATGVGLILGGMGAGLTGGPNQVLQMVNNQIDRDIDAQKAEQGKKLNILTALQQQYGNAQQAASMARVLKADQVSNNLAKIAALSKDPLAMDRANQAVAQIHIQTAPELQKVAMTQALNRMAGTGQLKPAQAVAWNPYMPQTLKTKALDEVANVEQNNSAMSDISDAMQQMKQLQAQKLNPLKYPEAAAKMKALQLRVASTGKEMFGRLNEQELNMLHDAGVNGFSDLLGDTVGTKIKSFQKIMERHMSTPTLDAYSIPIKKFNSNFTPR
jgi:hypothetical protein